MYWHGTGEDYYTEMITEQFLYFVNSYREKFVWLDVHCCDLILLRAKKKHMFYLLKKKKNVSPP